MVAIFHVLPLCLGDKVKSEKQVRVSLGALSSFFPQPLLSSPFTSSTQSSVVKRAAQSLVTGSLLLFPGATITDPKIVFEKLPALERDPEE